MKISKFQNNQRTNSSEELRNPDSSFLMEIRRSKVKPCRVPSKNKKYFFLSSFLSHFSGKIKNLKTKLILFI